MVITGLIAEVNSKHNQLITWLDWQVSLVTPLQAYSKMSGAGEQLSAEKLLRTLQRGKQPDTLGTKIGQALELITTLLDDLG